MPGAEPRKNATSYSHQKVIVKGRGLTEADKLGIPRQPICTYALFRKGVQHGQPTRLVEADASGFHDPLHLSLSPFVQSTARVAILDVA